MPAVELHSWVKTPDGIGRVIRYLSSRTVLVGFPGLTKRVYSVSEIVRHMRAPRVASRLGISRLTQGKVQKSITRRESGR